MTMREIRNQIQSGKATAETVTREYIARIAQWGGKDGLNAVAAVDPHALAEAREPDAHGDRTLPLFSVPILVKDILLGVHCNMHVAGLPCGWVWRRTVFLWV